jgi:hypothetical protein
VNALTPRTASALSIPDRLLLPALPAAAAAFVSRLDGWLEQRQRRDEAERRARESDKPNPAILRELEDTFVPAKPARPFLTDADRQMLAAALADMDARLAPVTAPVLAAWLAPINAVVRNPQSREDFQTRVLGLADLLADLPAGAFTAEARRSMAPDFFPSVGEIRRAVEPNARALLSRRKALDEMAAPPPAAPTPSDTPEKRSQEAVEAVRAKAAALVAELTQTGTTHRPTARAAPVSDGVLLAGYEIAAQNAATPAAREAAAYRAATIRKRLGIEA